MGLWQKAMETYDCHAHLVGQYREDHAVLAPIGHIVTKASLEITLDAQGNFRGAMAVERSEPKILIPVTEASAGRSGTTVCAHPLCDQLSYLAPCFPKKYADYVQKLTQWTDSEYTHPMLPPILAYIKNGTILDDLEQCDLIKCKADGMPEEDKLLVRWRVLNVGKEDACWRDPQLFQAFHRYYQAKLQNGSEDLCMITGKTTHIAQQHPKGVVAFQGSAKLISANDKNGFTYRGRFTDDHQAATVGYEASQKAHSAIRWLISEQGAAFGERVFLCWNPQGQPVCAATGAFANFGEQIVKPSNYRQALKTTLEGYRSQLPDQSGVVIAAFEAATTGRLSLTYYQELMGSDFLDRLYNWDLHCCWISYRYGGVQSPNLRTIINNAFGTQRSEKNNVRMVTDERVLSQQIQRLVSCRIDCAAMPWDIVLALMQKASAPLSHDKKVRESILFTACAVIRKYRYDRFKEEWEMILEPEKKDISYQFGRLLAVLEKVERDTYTGDAEREPNAIRQQSVFCQRPMYAAANIEKQLERAYFPRLKPGIRVYYKNMIGQIMEQINEYPEQQWNQPLKETYLMGYYLQRNALYTKQTKEAEEKENG